MFRSDADYRCSICGAGQSQLLTDAGERPFRFRVKDRERLTSLLGPEAVEVIPALEVQIRHYQCTEVGIDPLLQYLRTLPPATLTQMNRLPRLAAALSKLDAALRSYGERGAWCLFNEGRGYPAFESEDDDAWHEWLEDLRAMLDVASEDAKAKRRTGPRPDIRRTMLEHRLARVLADAGLGRATNVSIEAFCVAVRASTGTDYSDPKRALARAHKVALRKPSPSILARAKRADQRAKVRGFL